MDVEVCLRLRDEGCIERSGLVVLNEKSIKLENNNISKGIERISFSHVWKTQCTQRTIYSTLETSLLNCLMGYNLMILTMGHEETGKSYTMHGNEVHPGLIHHTLVNLFPQASQLSENGRKGHIYFHMSFSSLEKDGVYDALGKEKYKDSEAGYYSFNKGWKAEEIVERMTKLPIRTIEEALQIYRAGKQQILSQVEKQHTALTIYVEFHENMGTTFYGQMVFLDVVGSVTLIPQLVPVVKKGELRTKRLAFQNEPTLSKMYGNAVSESWKTIALVTVRQSAMHQQQTIQTLLHALKLKERKTSGSQNKRSTSVIQSVELSNKKEIYSDEPALALPPEEEERDDPVQEKRIEQCLQRLIDKDTSSPHPDLYDSNSPSSRPDQGIRTQVMNVKQIPSSPENVSPFVQQKGPSFQQEQSSLEDNQLEHDQRLPQNVVASFNRIFGEQSTLESSATVDQFENLLARIKTMYAYSTQSTLTQLEKTQEELKKVQTEMHSRAVPCQESTERLQRIVQQVHNAAVHVFSEVYDATDQPAITYSSNISDQEKIVDECVEQILGAVHSVSEAFGSEVAMKENCATKIASLKELVQMEKKTNRERVEQLLGDIRHLELELTQKETALKTLENLHQPHSASTVSQTMDWSSTNGGQSQGDIQHTMELFTSKLDRAMTDAKMILGSKDAKIAQLEKKIQELQVRNTDMRKEALTLEETMSQVHTQMQTLRMECQNKEQHSSSVFAELISFSCDVLKIEQKKGSKKGATVDDLVPAFRQMISQLQTLELRHQQFVQEIKIIKEKSKKQEKEDQDKIRFLQRKVWSLEAALKGSQSELELEASRIDSKQQDEIRMLQEDRDAYLRRSREQCAAYDNLQSQFTDLKVQGCEEVDKAQRKSRRRYREQLNRESKEMQTEHQLSLEAVKQQHTNYMEAAIDRARQEIIVEYENSLQDKEQMLQLEVDSLLETALGKQQRKHTEQVAGLEAEVDSRIEGAVLENIRAHKLLVAKMQDNYAADFQNEQEKVCTLEYKLNAMQEDMENLLTKSQTDTQGDIDSEERHYHEKMEQMMSSLSIANANETKAQDQIRAAQREMERMQTSHDAMTKQMSNVKSQTWDMFVNNEVGSNRLKYLEQELADVKMDLEEKQSRILETDKEVEAYVDREHLYETELTSLRLNMETWTKKYAACQAEFRQMAECHEEEIERLKQSVLKSNLDLSFESSPEMSSNDPLNFH